MNGWLRVGQQAGLVAAVALFAAAALRFHSVQGLLHWQAGIAVLLTDMVTLLLWPRADRADGPRTAGGP